MNEPYTVRDLARWFEGEGNVHVNVNGTFCLRGSSVDEDVIRHLHEQFGGSLRGRPLPSGKTEWLWSLSGYPAMRLARQMYPYLFTRRQQQMDAAFAQRRTVESTQGRDPTRNRVSRELGRLVGWCD